MSHHDECRDSALWIATLGNPLSGLACPQLLCGPVSSEARLFCSPCEWGPGLQQEEQGTESEMMETGLTGRQMGTAQRQCSATEVQDRES